MLKYPQNWRRQLKFKQQIFLNDFMNFDEILEENVTHNNINSHKKAGLHPVCKKYIFGKTILLRVKAMQKNVKKEILKLLRLSYNSNY